MAACVKKWLNPCTYGADENLCEKTPPVNSCICVAALIEIVKQYTSPTEKCSVWRRTLCPIIESDFYKKYSKCSIDKIVLAIGMIGFFMCFNSFNKQPWWSESESCFGNECPAMWTALVMFLYYKAYLLNTVGMITNGLLVYGIFTNIPDMVHLWLIWRTTATCLGIVTMGLIMFFSCLVRHDLKPVFAQEVFSAAVNVALWIAVFAYFQQICECEGGDTDGGDNDDDDGGNAETTDGFVADEFCISADSLETRVEIP